MVFSRLKSLVRLLPRPVYAILGSLYYIIHPKKPISVLIPQGNVWWVWSREGSQYVPTADLWYRGTSALHEQKFDRYTETELFEIQSTDVVVDVGAFIGEFTIPAAARADTVIAFEPTPASYECLTRNTADHDNVVTKQVLLNDSTSSVRFNIGNNPTESSIFEVDDGTAEPQTVDAHQLDKLLPEMGYNSIDLLKLEAEGSEPEILFGAADIRIEHIAVDAGPERKGAPSAPQVIEILESRGYKVEVNNTMVFGTLL